jgi:hypothetical protein
MLKNWKSLFVKTDENEAGENADALSFPLNNTISSADIPSQPLATPPPSAQDPVLMEVIGVYESGLDSINMPGYDFYEFYKSVSGTGQPGEQMYKMAFSMAKTLDKTITVQKLIHDAEFYISKINEVHGQYVNQGQQKLSTIQEQKQTEKNKLQSEIDSASARMAQLRTELQQLEAAITQNRHALSRIDENTYPQEKAIREKLSANDTARSFSIQRLNMVKDGIIKFVKD